MCFGTAVEEKLDAVETPEIQESADTQETVEEQGTVSSPLEAMIEVLLLEVINQNVDAAKLIGKEGINSVARALLMLPKDGPTTPEGREAFKQFVHSEAKRLVTGALAEEQGEVAGN